MNNVLEFPSADKLNSITKSLDQKTVSEISEKFLANEKLEKILKLYNTYEEGAHIDDALELFLTRYPNLEEFKNRAVPNMSSEELLLAYPDIKEMMQFFKAELYGEDGKTNYIKAPQSDQNADTQELPPLEDVLSGKFKKDTEIPPTPDFKSFSETGGEVKQVEFNPNIPYKDSSKDNQDNA